MDYKTLLSNKLMPKQASAWLKDEVPYRLATAVELK